MAAVITGVAAPSAAQDLARGQQLFEPCAACHKLQKDSGADGPSLIGVIGRTAGTLADFRFSRAMARAGWVWDEARLDAFMADPQGAVAGTRMAYPGMAEKADRAALIDYLKSLR